MDIDFVAIVKEKSTEELLEIVYQFDQWDKEMLQAAEDELAERNALPTDIYIRKQAIIKEEDERLSRGKEASLSGQVLGWIGIFGILGLIIGYNYTRSKVTSIYTGKEYYTYNEDSRSNGSYILIISITTHLLYLIYKIATFI